VRYLLSILIIFAISVSLFAADTSKETGKSKKSSRESSITQKKTKEQRESKGKKTSETTVQGLDKESRDTLKEVGESLKSTGVEITLNLENLFFPLIAEVEGGQEINRFTACKVITDPKLPRDFGISAEISPGVIDTIKSQWIANMAQANADLKDVSPEKVTELKHYSECLNFYGALIGQAYLNLEADLKSLGSVSKNGKGEMLVTGLKYDDLLLLASGALARANKEGFKNQTINSLFENVQRDLNSNSFRFDRSLENLKCGGVLITLGTIPQMNYSHVKVFGGSFAGYSGIFKVSKGFSYADAIEKLKSTASYSKFANEVSKYAEDLESQGRSKEAYLVRKKAWDLASSGKQVASISNLLPHVK